MDTELTIEFGFRVVTNQFPFGRFPRIFTTVHVIVLSHIFVKYPEHDSSNDARQEQHNHQRIQNAEPLDICVWHRFQNVVPSWRPFDVIVLNEFHRVRMRDIQFFTVVHCSRWNLKRFTTQTIQFSWILMIDGDGNNFSGDNSSTIRTESNAPFFCFATVVSDR